MSIGKLVSHHMIESRGIVTQKLFVPGFGTFIWILGCRSCDFIPTELVQQEIDVHNGVPSHDNEMS